MRGALPSMRIVAAIVAGALAVAGAAVGAPTNVAITQEGLALRISWTPDPPDASGHAVEVSNHPDFPDVATGNTCYDFVLGSNPTTLMRCLIPFSGTLHVRVDPTAVGVEATVVQVPQAAFNFTPSRSDPSRRRPGSGIGRPFAAGHRRPTGPT